MSNTVPELTKVGILKETEWGTSVNGTGGNYLFIPVEPPDLKEEIENIVDSNPRGVLGMDFETYAGMRKVTGTLKGPVYCSSNATGTSPGSSFAHIMRAFFGGDDSAIINAGSTFYHHEFYTAGTPGSISIAVEDDLTNATTNTVPVYAGCMIPKLTLSFNSSEGLLTWDAEVVGQRQTFLGTTSNPVYAANSMSADYSGEAMLGYQASVHYGTAALNPAATTGKLISAEIVFEREIDLKVGAANQNWPNIRAVRPTRVTFSAVMELQTYADVWKYSKNTPDAAPINSDFTDNQEAWTFRFCTDRTVSTATTEAGLNTALGAGESCLDIRLHTVSYGEEPLVINRSDNANTIEFSGRALYTTTPTYYFGGTPSADALAGSKVAQVRMLNQYSSDY
uniref:Tail protein n=2 Tax=viral metagenome TaxID=1070528 RepID=A0A6H1ZS07_9ZZZZ